MPEKKGDPNTPAATQHAVYEGDFIEPSLDKTLRAQIEKIRSMLEDVEGRVENKSLFDIVKECTPFDSPLMSFLNFRSWTMTTLSSLVSDGGIAPLANIHMPQDLLNAIDETDPRREYVLVLRDIDSDWCEALCARYPGSIDRKFLLEHILGLDLQLTPSSFYNSPYDSGRNFPRGMSRASRHTRLSHLVDRLEFDELVHESFLSTKKGMSTTEVPTKSTSKPFESNNAAEAGGMAIPGRFLEDSIHKEVPVTTTRLDGQITRACGFHVNWWRTSFPGSSEYHSTDWSTHEAFRRTENGWAKSNAFVSCCRLASNVYLALTSTTPSMQNDTKALSVDPMICVAPTFGSRLIVRIPDHDRDALIDDAVLSLIQQHRPMFKWECVCARDTSAWAQHQVDGFVFASLLQATVLQMGVAKGEDEMRDLAYLADAEDGIEHFKRLTDFRRVLARLHQSMGEAHDAFEASCIAELHSHRLVLRRDTYNAKHTATFAHEQAMEDSKRPQQSADFTKLHMESLQELQERLDAIKEDLNEEIQLAIGSVQVHDAQTIRKQTTWTVVLTVLAAIYLPMTLVTGIFGMNITEISSEATAPNAWWAFGAWAVVFAVTLGGILLYAAVRTWKAKKKKKRNVDLETGRLSSVSVGTARRRAGGGSGNGVKRWARDWRQKTKKAGTRKRE